MSITSKVHTGLSVLGLVLFIFFVTLLVMLMVLVRDLIELEDSLEIVKKLGDEFKEQYGWVLPNAQF